VRLFAERANALGQGFALTSSNVEAVAAICRRLDGIPLAIELAVPRLRVMSAQQLERALDERFRILTVGSRTALPRQQTLHALFEWSYDLLTEAEKLLLSRVSIFSGGASVASIIAVTAEIPQEHIPDLLLSLAEKSLVLAELGNEETRYRLLESTRYYAREKLGQNSDLPRRHVEHFVGRFTAATAVWETTPTQQWLDQYGADIDNLRSALKWAFAPDGDVTLGLDLVGRSHVIWAELGLMLEHRRWVDEALAKVSERTPADITARLLSWQAGDVREIDDPADYDEALRAASLFRKIGDRFSEGRVLLRAGISRLLPDSAGESERILQRAYGLLHPSGPTKTLAGCMSALASARLFAGDSVTARSLHEEAIQIHRAIGESQ